MYEQNWLHKQPQYHCWQCQHQSHCQQQYQHQSYFQLLVPRDLYTSGSTSIKPLFLDLLTALAYLPDIAFTLSSLSSESCPRLMEGAQSGLFSSNSAAGEPEIKWSEHTRVLKYWSCFRFFLFIFASRSTCLHQLRSNAFAPW